MNALNPTALSADDTFTHHYVRVDGKKSTA